MRKIIILGTLILAGLALYAGLTIQKSNNGKLVANRSDENHPSSIKFNLIDHKGQSVSEKTYQGKWLLVFFGFTNCPDICPTSLAEMSQLLDALGGKADEIAPLFISIDPARDRGPAIAEYVAAFHPAIIGLSGNDDQTAKTAKSFAAYYEKIPDEDAPGGYSMAHNSAIYLISPEGYFIQTYAYGTPIQEIIQDLMAKMNA